jgi:PncC family amidohydrolase
MDGTEDAARRVVELLTLLNLTLALAESCTGGLIGHLITNVPGSSRCFLGSVVAYHARAKTDILGVPNEMLEVHGSVSAETALAMAGGVRLVLDADVGVGVTGILGPDGGTEEKPVGLVYLALSDREGRVFARREVWSGSREANEAQSARAALALIEEYIAQRANN